ncbi:HIT domain-containing protein [Corynebacterium canis]|uniref:HIT domain-containing protein n=1 Tax=Corynebacterium canis TaxID=679663 RepID=A0A5C5UGI2_9CORY|nr:HIT domain-containing protein [Corynebacterium canis]TWT24570.1 HIT domain-containing protein [Corynebacterium canis]WJY75450.1 AP-4-A phosphorylase [Corynebacterium canis]
MTNRVRNLLQHDDSFVDQGLGTPDRLERLWAPYRMHYIAQGANEDEGRFRDPFLEVPRMSDEEGLIVARGELVYCVLNLFPYNSGHMLVVPFRKVAEFEHLTPPEMTELMLFGQTAIRALKQVSRPHAINLGFNLGRSSGGSVGDHLHMHVVPRWSGDANFMTIIDGVKVLPQVLRETRALLARAWSELEDAPGSVTL